MQLFPIQTPLLKEEDDFSRIIAEASSIEDGDIIVISSKAVAMVEGVLIDLSTIEVSEEAQQWTETLHRNHPDPAFRQAVLDEAQRMNGSVINTCPQAMLAELKPEGLEQGVILAVNAGLDRSNAPEGFAIGWPHDPVASTSNIRSQVQEITGKNIAVILTDSCCRPRRIGVTAIALTVSGMDPLQSQMGKEDLFGRDLRMTQEAVADQLATAANFLMGNAAESIPAVLIRDHGITLNDAEGWVPGIDPEEDLFKGML